jgi:hypothetical protein
LLELGGQISRYEEVGQTDEDVIQQETPGNPDSSALTEYEQQPLEDETKVQHRLAQNSIDEIGTHTDEKGVQHNIAQSLANESGTHQHKAQDKKRSKININLDIRR